MNDTHRIVSSEAEELILVDPDDNPTGHRSKADCHDGDGILHRAFSVFLFNASGEMLIQRRAAAKRLWPGYWSNSCCSHPRRGESLETATQRRLLDELNVELPLEFVYRFQYQAKFGSIGAENELCHVYLGRLQGEVQANRSEIDATRYVAPAAIEREFVADPGAFTPWFRMEWQALRNDYPAHLDRYISSRSS